MHFSCLRRRRLMFGRIYQCHMSGRNEKKNLCDFKLSFVYRGTCQRVLKFTYSDGLDWFTSQPSQTKWLQLCWCHGKTVHGARQQKEMNNIFDPSYKLLCLWNTRIFDAAHAGCSSSSTKELHDVSNRRNTYITIRHLCI